MTHSYMAIPDWVFWWRPELIGGEWHHILGIRDDWLVQDWLTLGGDWLLSILTPFVVIGEFQGCVIVSWLIWMTPFFSDCKWYCCVEPSWIGPTGLLISFFIFQDGEVLYLSSCLMSWSWIFHIFQVDSSSSSYECGYSCFLLSFQSTNCFFVWFVFCGEIYYFQ